MINPCSVSVHKQGSQYQPYPESVTKTHHVQALDANTSTTTKRKLHTPNVNETSSPPLKRKRVSAMSLSSAQRQGVAFTVGIVRQGGPNENFNGRHLPSLGNVKTSQHIADPSNTRPSAGGMHGYHASSPKDVYWASPRDLGGHHLLGPGRTQHLNGRMPHSARSNGAQAFSSSSHEIYGMHDDSMDWAARRNLGGHHPPGPCSMQHLPSPERSNRTYSSNDHEAYGMSGENLHWTSHRNLDGHHSPGPRSRQPLPSPARTSGAHSSGSHEGYGMHSDYISSTAYRQGQFVAPSYGDPAPRNLRGHHLQGPGCTQHFDGHMPSPGRPNGAYSSRNHEVYGMSSDYMPRTADSQSRYGDRFHRSTIGAVAGGTIGGANSVEVGNVQEQYGDEIGCDSIDFLHGPIGDDNHDHSAEGDNTGFAVCDGIEYPNNAQ